MSNTPDPARDRSRQPRANPAFYSDRDPLDAALHAMRADLRNAMKQAAAYIHTAQHQLSLLSSPEWCDVEYAEGPSGADMRTFLDDARRSLRATQALNPTKDAD